VQELVWANAPAFVPARLTEDTVKDDVPVFRTVTDCAALVAPTVVEANVSDAGVTDPVTVAATAVPVSDTVLAVVLPVLAIDSVPVTVPAAVGAKATETVHLPAAATALVQPFVTLNAALLEVTDETVIDVVPVFDTVTACVALVVPTAWEAKLSDVGDTEATAAA
jgi:hypothetical protein